MTTTLSEKKFMSDNKSTGNQARVDHYYQTRDEVLNKISPTFCAAKWLQSTIYLWNGHTHSCHHPIPHQVDIEAVKKNPKALHNTPTKLCARKDMLEGIQTKECTYCWNIENLDSEHMSDRTYKSAVSWSLPHIDEIVASGTGEHINPTYMEVAFENTCNLKCTYCSPDISSRWMEEIQIYGSYKLEEFSLHDLDYLKKTGRYPIHRDDPNAYVDAFWQWWPELYQSLKVFRITGGEPLLSKHTWRVFDYIIENPRPDLDLAVNTNLSVSQKIIEKLVEYSNKLKGKVKTFEIYTSCEATGEQAEYIRFGLDYNQFMKNIEYILGNTPHEIRINFMITMNLLSASTFRLFLERILELRETFQSPPDEFGVNLNRTPIMISYLRWPEFLSLRNLPDLLKNKYAALWREFALNNTFDARPGGLGRIYLEEADQINRLVDFMLTTEPLLIKNMKNFYYYHIQYDLRRNTNLLNVFPELSEFYSDCQLLAGKKNE
jgi:pyruvate-formate lyase-activating enzyme